MWILLKTFWSDLKLIHVRRNVSFNLAKDVTDNVDHFYHLSVCLSLSILFLLTQISFDGAAGKFCFWGTSRSSVVDLWSRSPWNENVLQSGRFDWLVSGSLWTWTSFPAPCTLPGCILVFLKIYWINFVTKTLLSFSFWSFCCTSWCAARIPL